MTATIGHNNPPEPTPYETAKEKIEGLYAEAKNWMDGTLIARQDQADEIQKLMRLIQTAEKEADASRKEEVRPFDDAKAEVQARYNELIGSTKAVTGLTVKAIDACKKALAPWLIKIEEENERIREVARAEAAEAQRVAMEAMRQRDGTNLEENERAEQLVRQAKEAEAYARKADNLKASVKSIGRAASLRTSHIAQITDPTVFARHCWLTQRSDVDAFFASLAQRLVDAKHRNIPGVSIIEEKKVA
ncbi:hypothetical protein ACTJJ7_20170 [Phyllobacterium sp. 22229]|uniref:hypothetical protein n=1 Tax=Phyllobacterium sp. 22229 TaxID=3453895 RepID=UPI003F824ED2